MNKLKWPALFSIVALTLAASLPGARAAPVTFELDVGVNGITPIGTSPWMTATFTDVAAGVQLVMTNNMPSYEFIDSVVLNSKIDPTTLTFTHQTTAPPAVNGYDTSSSQDLTGGANVKAGLFNVLLDYAPPPGGATNVWSGGLSSTWLITGTGVTAANFLLQSLGNESMLGGYYMAAHIQGITGGYSGSIAVVPEPETYAMMMVGLALAGLIGRRRLRRDVA